MVVAWPGVEWHDSAMAAMAPCVRVTEPGPQLLAALWSETQMATPPAQKVSSIRGGTGGFGIHI